MQSRVCPEASETVHERRPYEPPRVGRVNLEADEVLSAGCKSEYVSGSIPEAPCDWAGCTALGS